MYDNMISINEYRFYTLIFEEQRSLYNIAKMSIVIGSGTISLFYSIIRTAYYDINLPMHVPCAIIYFA